MSEFLAGAGLLGRGLSLIVRRPRMFGYGAIPPLVTSLLFTAVLVGLVAELDRLVGWLTPFANGWTPGLVTAVHLLVGLAVVAGAVLLMVVTFTTLTMTLGSPLYDKISESVEAELGNAPTAVDEPLVTSLTRGLRQSLALIGVSLLAAPLLFLAGFVPVVGQVVVPVVSAIFGGWMLCIELVGSAFDRRGLTRLRDRRRAMRTRRARVLGLAIPVFLLLAIPFVAVLVFPVATAAGTILARDLLGTRDQQPKTATIR